jgi:hypothetical protein
MRGFLNTPERDVEVLQLRNRDEESLVLRRFPFHECATRQAVLTMYRNAVQYMFQVVPEEKFIAVMNRLSRKLVKRMKQLDNAGRE